MMVVEIGSADDANVHGVQPDGVSDVEMVSGFVGHGVNSSNDIPAWIAEFSTSHNLQS
jgi:hypothetical protein